MRILFLEDLWTVLLCFFLWPFIQVLISTLCLKIPDAKFHPASFWYRSHAWEQGGIFYQRVFRIRKWKELLPDGGKAYKKGFQKKRLSDASDANLEKFLIESCRAELAHWLSILPFWLFGFIAPAIVIPVMFFYSLLVNFPCIVAQRFNRPRIHKLMQNRKSASSSRLL